MKNPRSPYSRRLLLVASLAAAIAMLWSAWHGQEPPSSAGMDYPHPSAGPAEAPPPVPVDVLRIGTLADEVMHIEGRPMINNSGRWEYGPSWIRIEDGRVVDWYSSPLRPLHVNGHEEPPSR